MHFPLLLNDIYLSDEYYGENVLHMSCVAEDPSVVKWLLDIGADFNRWTLIIQQVFKPDSTTMDNPRPIIQSLLWTIFSSRNKT